MNDRRFVRGLKRIQERLHGVEHNPYQYRRLVEGIRINEGSLKPKSDPELQALFQSLKARAGQGLHLDELLPECYALVAEAVRRLLNINTHDVQLMGAIVLHGGMLAQMETGEGKTVTAVFPACLNSLIDRVHVLTFNDYLARRDSEWMGPIYLLLGLEVGCVAEGMSAAQRRKAYGADIVYLTAKEASFDYLRDSLSFSREERVRCPANFAVIDEADSILIDEARVPLVIAGSRDDSAGDVHRVRGVVQQLRRDVDVEINEGNRNVSLTERGLRRVEELLDCPDLYAERDLDLLTLLNCALHAEFLLWKDVDYIVRRGRIELVDDSPAVWQTEGDGPTDCRPPWRPRRAC